MYYGAIKKSDIANGEGIRTSLFVSGCRNACKNCFNKETWAFDFGQPFTETTAEEIYKTFENPVVAGLTVLGGEPMEPENQEALLPFLKEFKRRYPKKTLWIFTGNLYEELTGQMGAHPKYLPITAEILALTDILVDGRYEEEKKSLGIRFRGSSNQRIIDMNKTRVSGEIVIWEGCKKDRVFEIKESKE